MINRTAAAVMRASMSSMAIKNIVKPATAIGVRTFMSGLSSCQAPIQLPPNLKLSDPSLLEQLAVEEKVEEKRLIDGLDQYQFALLPSQIPKTVPVRSLSDPNKIVSEAPLDPTVFTVPLRKDLVLNVVRYIRHARRQPKKTKRMSEIRGSNKKPRPQKGQGVGQVGHRRNSAWRGGQKAMGPVLRSYAIDMNKKQRALGTMMTIAAKFREGNLIVVDSFEMQVR